MLLKDLGLFPAIYPDRVFLAMVFFLQFANLVYQVLLELCSTVKTSLPIAITLIGMNS